MKTTFIAPGLKRVDQYTIKDEHTAIHLGSGNLKVLATPSMILFMEMAARKLLAQYLPPGQSSVGTRVDVRHLAPAAVGAVVNVLAEVTVVDGQKITFNITASVGEKIIGAGTHWRYIIDEAQFLDRLK